MPRLRTDFFIDAYRLKCEAHGAFIVMRKRGDGTAGAIYVRYQVRGGPVDLYAPVPNFDDPDERAWILLRPGLCGHNAAEDAITGIVASDTDAWVIDVDAADDGCRPVPVVS